MRRPLIALALTLLSACADLGRYVWAREVQAPPADRGFVIAPNDVILVRVYQQDAINTRAKVRTDGSITLPLLNDVDAAGYSPANLGKQLETRYKEFFKTPLVAVSVEEIAPLPIPVAGEVTRQGVQLTERPAGVLKVLLLAGGLTELGHRDRIFVLRPGTPALRIRFTWEGLTRGEPSEANFELRSGDAIVVE